MITKGHVQEFFDQLSSHGVSLKRPMRWEFFFCDHDQARLETLEPELRAWGFVDIEVPEPSPDDDDDEDETFFLQAVKIEQLSVGDLYRRCEELTAFAKKYGVETFDGFDVSNVDERQPLY